MKERLLKVKEIAAALKVGDALLSCSQPAHLTREPAFPTLLTTRVFSKRSSGRLEASPAGATPEGRRSFISCTAPSSETPCQAPFDVRDIGGHKVRRAV